MGEIDFIEFIKQWLSQSRNSPFSLFGENTTPTFSNSNSATETSQLATKATDVGQNSSILKKESASLFDLYLQYKKNELVNKAKSMIDTGFSIQHNQRGPDLLSQSNTFNPDTYQQQQDTLLAMAQSNNPANKTVGRLIVDDIVKEGAQNIKNASKFLGSTTPEQPKINMEKAGQYAGMAINAIGNAADMIGGGSGTQNSEITTGLNQMATAAESMPGLAGAIAKTGNAVGKVANNTYNKISEYDDQSVATQIAGSNILGIFGANRWNSKKFGNFSVDPQLRAKLGSSYSSSFKKFDYAANNISGKTIGTFDKSKMQKRWDTALSQYNTTTGIMAENDDVLARSSEMAAINANRRMWELGGGYDLAGIRAAKEGMKIEEETNNSVINQKPKLLPDWNPRDIPDYLLEIPEFIPKQLPDIEFSTDEVPNIKEIINNSDAPFVKRLLDPARKSIPDWEDPKRISNFKMSYGIKKDKNGNDRYIVYPKIQEVNGQLHDFTDPQYNHGKWDALKNATKNNDFIYMDSEKAAKYFTEHYKEEFPDIFQFAKGGAMNVIPEGALHARKHNMDMEGITKKGIPVISETEDGEIQQQAEIEHSEIILRLEVTQLLEELLKEYEKTDPQKEKDELAIEAGKLLTEEILYNTDDRTNLIQQV